MFKDRLEKWIAPRREHLRVSHNLLLFSGDLLSSLAVYDSYLFAVQKYDLVTLFDGVSRNTCIVMIARDDLVAADVSLLLRPLRIFICDGLAYKLSGTGPLPQLLLRYRNSGTKHQG